MLPSYKTSIELDEPDDNQISDNSPQEIQTDDPVAICENVLIDQSITLFDNNISPLDTLFAKYGETTPIFNIQFFQSFIRYFNETNDTKLLFYLINGPPENSTRLIQLQFFDFLYSNLPSNFPIIHHIISQTTNSGKEIFIHTGGLYVLFYFITEPNSSQLILAIFEMISNLELDLCEDILPPNAFSPIQCNFDTTQILKFDSFLNIIISFEDSVPLSHVISSLLNVFRSSEKVVERFGMIIFDSSFIFNMLNVFDDNYLIIHKLIELFNILCDHFDMDIFRIDLVHYFFELFKICEYNLKISLIPSFLQTIETTNTTICCQLLSRETIDILDDFLHLEGKTHVHAILDIIDEFSAQIVLLSDQEMDLNGNDSLPQLKTMLDGLVDDNDQSISQKATSVIELIESLF